MNKDLLYKKSKKFLKSYFLNLKSNLGFTLVELIVVLSVAAVISIIGIAAFVSYNQTQSLNTSAGDVVNMFSLAKSRAASGAKPSTAPCSVQPLSGYRISITTPRTYSLDAVCSTGTSNILTSIMPSTISFNANKTFTFFVLTGGFSGGSTTIVLSGFGKTKTLTVDISGNIN